MLKVNMNHWNEFLSIGVDESFDLMMMMKYLYQVKFRNLLKKIMTMNDIHLDQSKSNSMK
jgi:hypothetical protein